MNVVAIQSLEGIPAAVSAMIVAVSEKDWLMTLNRFPFY